MAAVRGVQSPAPGGVVVEHVRWGYEISVAGPIGVRTSGDLRDALFSAIESGHGDLVLHLGQAEVWDSTGLGVIVGAHHRAIQRGRTLVLADASPRLVRLVRRTRLERVIKLQETSGAPELAAIA